MTLYKDKTKVFNIKSIIITKIPFLQKIKKRGI